MNDAINRLVRQKGVFWVIMPKEVSFTLSPNSPLVTWISAKREPERLVDAEEGVRKEMKIINAEAIVPFLRGDMLIAMLVLPKSKVASSIRLKSLQAYMQRWIEPICMAWEYEDAVGRVIEND